MRAANADNMAFADELDEDGNTCPNCQDCRSFLHVLHQFFLTSDGMIVFMNNSGRVLICGHQICFDCTLDLSNSLIAHDGVL